VETTASAGIARVFLSACPLGPRLVRDPAAGFCARITSAPDPVGLAEFLPPPRKDAC
jgi:hypothetical protein